MMLSGRRSITDAAVENMGVNSIRLYTGVPAKWIRYIYEQYGIYTMLNHSSAATDLRLKRQMGC